MGVTFIKSYSETYNVVHWLDDDFSRETGSTGVTPPRMGTPQTPSTRPTSTDPTTRTRVPITGIEVGFALLHQERKKKHGKRNGKANH